MSRLRASGVPVAVLLALLLGLAAGCARKSLQAPPTSPGPRETPPSANEREQLPPSPVTSGPESATTEALLPVFFSYDSWGLDEAARAALDRNAKLLRKRDPVSVVVEGHCDERGTVEYNQALGERRARAAAEYLEAAGVARARIEVVSWGKERPFDDGHTEASWSANRRAHLTLR